MLSNPFKIFLLLFLFLAIGNLKAQGYFKTMRQVGMSEKNLSYQKKNPEKVTTFLNLSKWYLQHYNDSETTSRKSLHFAYQALSLSKTIQYSKGISESSLQLAIVLQQAQQYLNAKKYAKQAIEGFKKLNLQDRLGESWVMYWSSGFLSGMPYTERIPILQNAAIAFHKSGKREREADCYKEIGDIYQILGDGPTAIVFLKKAEHLYNKDNYQRLNGVYDLLGTVHEYIGDYKTAIDYGLKSIRLAEKRHDNTLFICTVYNRMGVTYYGVHDYKNALKYFDQSLKIAIRYNDSQYIGELIRNYCNTLVKQKKITAALKFLNTMKNNYPEIFHSKSTAFDCQYIRIYTILHQYQKAKQYIVPIKKKIKILTDDSDILGSYSTIMRLSLYLKNYKEASLCVASYDSLAKKINQDKNLEISSYMKYSIDSAQGNCVSAMKNYRDYVKYSRNIFDENKTRQINQMTILYETEKKDKNILQLRNNSIIQKNKLHHASILNNLMIICTISLLIIITLLYRVYTVKRRTNKVLSEQQDEINKKNITLQNLVTEKEWLLKEIHHRVKNNLHMVVGLLASQVEYLKNEEAVQAINDSQNRIQAMSLIHQKLYQSENLSMINMPPYVFELTEYLKDSFDIRKSIRFTFDIDNFDLPLSHSIPIGLIFNEAVTNSIKYAFPNKAEGKIYISLKANENQEITLIIHDNGIGLPSEFDPYNNPSLGIKLMHGLSEDIRGEFKIENVKGTKVSLKFIFNETTIA